MTTDLSAPFYIAGYQIGFLLIELAFFIIRTTSSHIICQITMFNKLRKKTVIGFTSNNNLDNIPSASGVIKDLGNVEPSVGVWKDVSGAQLNSV